MKLAKRCLLFILSLELLFVLPLTVFTGNAFAASDYDDLIVIPTSLTVSGFGKDTLDITNTYMEYILGSITENVASNSCDSTCKDAINTSLGQGDWVIQQVYTNYPSDNTFVTAVFCDQHIDSNLFHTNTYGASVEKILTGSFSSGANCESINIQYVNTYSGYKLYVSATANYIGGFSIADTFKNGSGVIQTSIQPYLFTGAITTNPDGYLGVSVPFGSSPPAITGNVQCIKPNSITAVHINTQSGIDGNATLTNDGMGGVDYKYYMWKESPYSIIVICDGDSYYGPTVEDTFYYKYYWTCAYSDTQPYCYS